MKTTHATTAAVCLLALAATVSLSAQTPAASETNKPMTRVEIAEHFQRDSVNRTYPLHYASSQAEQNEMITALRNIADPQTKIFLVPSENIIAVRAPIEEQERVDKLLAVLDKPQPRFRVTYTLTELDGGKKIGVQHFSMVVLNGQRSQLKQGSRLPISQGGSQFTYIDVGMNFDATLSAVQGGGVIKSNVEQTSIAPDSASPANPNPVIRQTRLEGTTSLVTGKPLLIGTIDVPASTRHFDVEVQMDPAN